MSGAGASRNLLLLGWVSLLTDASSQMIFPLLPFFLSSVLGAAPWTIGAIEGAAESLSAWLKGWSGKRSDQDGRRKPYVVLGYGLSTLAKLLFLPALSWTLVLIARLAERIGKGLRSAPRDALIADTVPPDRRGAAFGWQRSMDAAGGVLGALLAWVLFDHYDYSGVFLWALVPATLAVLLTCFLAEVAVAPPDRPLAPTRSPLSPALRRALWVVALNTAGRLSFAFLLLAAGSATWTVTDALLLYAGYQAVYALLGTPLGRMADRLGRRVLLQAGAGHLLLAYAALAAGAGGSTAATPLLLLAMLAYAIGEAALDSTQRAWFADLAPRGERGRVLGAYHAVVAFVALPGGLLLGWLWGQQIVLACAAAAALTLLGMGLTRRT